MVPNMRDAYATGEFALREVATDKEQDFWKVCWVLSHSVIAGIVAIAIGRVVCNGGLGRSCHCSLVVTKKKKKIR